MSLSQDFHTITGFLCTNGQYSKRYQQLNASGVISPKQKDLLLFTLLDHVEALENTKQQPIDVEAAIGNYFDKLIEQAKSKVAEEKAVFEPPAGFPEKIMPFFDGIDNLSWADLRAKGKEYGIYKVGQKASELKELIKQHEAKK